MTRIGKLLSVGSGLLLGQLLFQSLQASPDWSMAWERFWFQINAVLMYEMLWSNYE